MTRLIFGLVAAMLLSACVAGHPYGRYKWRPFVGVSGYRDVPAASADQASVWYTGTYGTPRRLVQAYLLNRCAEVTLQAGYRYFSVEEWLTDTRTLSWTEPARVATNGTADIEETGQAGLGGWSTDTSVQARVTSTVTPSSTTKYHRFTEGARVTLLESPGDAEDGVVVDAEQLVELVRPYLGDRLAAVALTEDYLRAAIVE